MFAPTRSPLPPSTRPPLRCVAPRSPPSALTFSFALLRFALICSWGDFFACSSMGRPCLLWDARACSGMMFTPSCPFHPTPSPALCCTSLTCATVAGHKLCTGADLAARQHRHRPVTHYTQPTRRWAGVCVCGEGASVGSRVDVCLARAGFTTHHGSCTYRCKETTDLTFIHLDRLAANRFTVELASSPFLLG